MPDLLSATTIQHGLIEKLPKKVHQAKAPQKCNAPARAWFFVYCTGQLTIITHNQTKEVHTMWTKRCCAALLLVTLLTSIAIAAKPKLMSIQIGNGDLRSTPEFWGAIVAPVKYTERVTVVESKGSWTKVTAPSGKTGWIHSSALTTTKLKDNSGDTDVASTASDGEMADTSRGFSPEAEKGLREKNPNLSFDAVDRMQQAKVSIEQVQAFLKQGQVEGPKGGAK